MSWFTKICRNAGLTIHKAGQALRQETNKHEVNRTVEEKRINETTVLRRTTIEEIEIRSQATADSDKENNPDSTKDAQN